MITNVYIDGMNLFYRSLKGTPYKWLDLVALSRILLPNDTIRLVRYFTAKVIDNPRNPGTHQRQNTYLRALGTLPEVRVHLGHFRQDRVRMPVASPPPNTIEVIKTEEKGSDVNLATYLMLDALDGSCEQQLVITNDADLAEPIRVVRQKLHRPVGIVNPTSSGRRTTRLQGDFFLQVTSAMLGGAQLPASLKDARGPFSKPSDW